MKRALCFVVLINKEAKTVLDWLLSDKFIRGFHMYDLRSVGTYAGSIDKMESSVYTIVVHNGEAEVFGDISSAVIKYKDDNLVFLTYAEWEELFDGTNPKAVLKWTEHYHDNEQKELPMYRPSDGYGTCG